MRKPVVTVAIWALALIGGGVVLLNLGWNLGILSLCEQAQERSSASPDGANVVIVGVAECGNEKYHLTARLLSPSGRENTLFSGFAQSSEAALETRCRSPSDLQIIYAPDIALEFPTSDSGLSAMHDFGSVQVRYTQR
jgi:hypothetical protein